MLDIYLAAQYERKQEMQGIRDRLERMGYRVVSRWIDNIDDEEGLGKDVLTKNPTLGIPHAIKDIVDLGAADAVVVFTSGNGGGRGGLEAMMSSMSQSLMIVLSVFVGLTGAALGCLLALLDQRRRHGSRE